MKNVAFEESLRVEQASEIEDEAGGTLPAALELPRSAIPRVSRLEIGVIIGLSALLHAGFAAAAIQSRETSAPKALSRVQIAMERAPRRVPEPPKHEAPPPPPKPRPLARAEQPRPTAKAPEPNAPPEPTPTPTDTGSSAPAAADGELRAGSGGLGAAAPPPSAPPAPPAPKPEPAHVVQAREGANYSKNPRPPYPSLARRQGWEGTTLLRVQVTPSGKPSAIQVQRTSGRSALDDAALEAVKRWSFVPATQGGTPVSGWVTVPIVFRLQ